MNREHQDIVVGASGFGYGRVATEKGECSSISNGKAKLWEGKPDLGAMDELLAAMDYKVRSSDMADVAQKLEELEMMMGIVEDEISHLASNTVHYDPTNLYGWVQTMLRSAAQTKKTFLFGSIEMMIKLVPGNSAGTVTAYYLSSVGSQHDEIDFEFLGNITGQPYIVHTNIYTNGTGKREQQFYLWFDPTTDFHNYTIHWNPAEIVWYIDGLPIRVFRNYEKEGIAYPNKQGMRVYTTLWNADNWATRGGLVKIDWCSAPFKARLHGFRARACRWTGPRSIPQCASNVSANWWTSPQYKQLNYAQMGQSKWVRKNYMIYDYCTDFSRFNGQPPPECFRQQF